VVSILSSYAACHTLTRINEEVVGDPLDLKMLAFTQYELDEPAATNAKQTYVDMPFPTIMRPINFLTNASPTRLSRSDSSLINDVSKSIMVFLFIGFRLVVFFFCSTLHLKWASSDNYHLARLFNGQALSFVFLLGIHSIYSPKVHQRK
jgi:hypothetical protein